MFFVFLMVVTLFLLLAIQRCYVCMKKSAVAALVLSRLMIN